MNKEMIEYINLQGEGELQVCFHEAVWRKKILVGSQSSFRALMRTESGSHQKPPD